MIIEERASITDKHLPVASSKGPWDSDNFLTSSLKSSPPVFSNTDPANKLSLLITQSQMPLDNNTHFIDSLKWKGRIPQVVPIEGNHPQPDVID